MLCCVLMLCYAMLLFVPPGSPASSYEVSSSYCLLLSVTVCYRTIEMVCSIESGSSLYACGNRQ